jgi:hypothetical protein
LCSAVRSASRLQHIGTHMPINITSQLRFAVAFCSPPRELHTSCFISYFRKFKTKNEESVDIISLGSTQFVQEDFELVRRLGYNHFLPNSLQFIFHQSLRCVN